MAMEDHQEKEMWEDEADKVDFAVTPPTSRHIPLYPWVLLQPPTTTNDINHPTSISCSYPTGITIQSVDITQMSLLDVCNYDTDDPHVDGSGHCIWMGALFFVHALAVAWAAEAAAATSEHDDADADAKDVGSLAWFHKDYFQDQRVEEMGCGTGTAGIALLKLSSSSSSSFSNSRLPTIQHLTFSDNDPQALELCRQNCHDNAIDENKYTVQHQATWLEEEYEDETKGRDSTMDTILATDVLYDLKIIRPFFQVASRSLSWSQQGSPPNSSSHDGSTNHTSSPMDGASTRKKKKYLILSHVPRWFLPTTPKTTQDTDCDDKETQHSPMVTRAEALELYIQQEASRCGFTMVKTVRPTHVLACYKTLVEPNTVARSAAEDAALRDDLNEMDQTGAVLWVFEKNRTHVMTQRILGRGPGKVEINCNLVI